MSDVSLLSPDELTKLGAAGDPETIGGIAAIEARVLYEISSFVSQLAKHLGALAGTQPDGKTVGVSVHPDSITAIGSTVASWFSQAILPQITENTQQIKHHAASLDKATAQIGNHENELRNIHHTLRLTGEHLQRLQRDEIMAEISQGIRAELVALITAEWSERFQQHEAQQAVLGSKFEELEKSVRQRQESEQQGGAERRPSPRRPS